MSKTIKTNACMNLSKAFSEKKKYLTKLYIAPIAITLNPTLYQRGLFFILDSINTVCTDSLCFSTRLSLVIDFKEFSICRYGSLFDQFSIVFLRSRKEIIAYRISARFVEKLIFVLLDAIKVFHSLHFVIK